MFNFRKILIKFAFLSIAVTPIVSVSSCSKVKKKSNFNVNFNWDENQKLSLNQIALINISNFQELENSGFTSNMVVNIQGNSVKQIKINESKSTDHITLTGVGNGVSTVTVKYINVITQEIAEGSFKIEVVDYSQIKIDYNEDNSEDNPFQINALDSIVVGRFKNKDWNMFSSIFKESLKIETSDIGESKQPISDILDFFINDNGEIIGKAKASSAGWEKKSQFKIKVSDSQNNTNFEDEGHNFWLDKIDPTITLKIQQPDDIVLPYNGDSNDYNKNQEMLSPITFKVENEDFDFDLATDSVLKNIQNNIEISSIYNSDILSNLVLTKDENNRAFKLIFKFKEISFSAINLKVKFMFSQKTGVFFGQTINVTIKSHRHGVKEIDKDGINNREIKIDYNDNESFDFGIDNNLNKQDLINPFKFNPDYSDTITDKIKNNGYNYLNSVVLTSTSFNKIKSLDLKDSENEDEIKKQNDAIQQIDISKDEKDYQENTGVSLTADWKNNKLELDSPGIKLDENNSYKSGEYFIVSKFKDNRNNYQFTYADFKWKAGKIDFPTSPFKIESHLYSMPIKKNFQNKANFDDVRAGSNLINGEDTGAGTIDNPLMLTETDSTIGAPDPSRRFSQGEGEDEEKNPYRGYLEIDNINPDQDLKSINLSIINGSSIAKLDNEPIIKINDKFYINMHLIGQGKKDVKGSKFSIKIGVPNQIDCIFDVYYSSYIGREQGDFVAEDFITTQTSIFVSGTARNRTLYLGLPTNSTGSINDVFFNGNYSYKGTQGAVTTNVGPNKDEPDALKNVNNITFGGKLKNQGSYVVMTSPNSGIAGYITFCEEIEFTSSNNYITASNKSDDPGFNNSAVLLAGNLKNKVSTPIMGEKGISFNNGVLVDLDSYNGDTRSKDSVSVIATTKNMVLGSISIDSKVNPCMLETNTTHIRDSSFITNEIITADNTVKPNQKMGSINLNSGFVMAGDAEIENYSVFNGLLIDKNAFNPHDLYSDDKSKMTDININESGGTKGNYIGTISNIKNNKNNIKDAFFILTDLDGSNYGDNNISSLPNINIEGEIAIPTTQGDHKNQCFPILAKGKYASNQTGYIKCTQGTFNYSNLEAYYNEYTQISF